MNSYRLMNVHINHMVEEESFCTHKEVFRRSIFSTFLAYVSQKKPVDNYSVVHFHDKGFRAMSLEEWLENNKPRTSQIDETTGLRY